VGEPTHTFTVREEQTGERLDRVIFEFLESQNPQEYSRTSLQASIHNGDVEVDGQLIRKPSYKVSFGQQIRLVSSPTTQHDTLEPYEFPLDVRFEDEEILVLAKPIGLTVHPGAGNAQRTLLNALLARDPSHSGSCVRGGLVHRLDKDTSGLLVIAKTPRAQRVLAQQFANRSVEKFYHALVVTTPRAKRLVQLSEHGVIESALGRDPHMRTRMAVVENGRMAKTEWWVAERFTWGTLLRIQLHTGRTHQIRVHFANAGSPLVGDTLYGEVAPLPVELQRIAKGYGHQALHASTLSFAHPTSGEWMTFQEELPESFRKLLDAFREFQNMSR